jgi:site-specific DNA recombinase
VPAANTPPILVYVRVSRVGDRDETRLRSPDEQAQRARKFAEDNGFVVGRTIPDIDQSGGTHPLDRPGMAEAIREVEAGRAGGIVAYDSSRLSREPSHLEWLAGKMRQHDAVLLWSGMPADPHSPIGELQVGLLAQIDRYQRKQAGERFSMAAEAAVLRGIPHGMVPFGYRQLPDRTIEPDPVTAPLVRTVYERRIQGEGWGVIALWLGEQTDRTWSRRGVGHLVKRELYRTGRLTIGDVVSEVDSGAIVDEATWHAAQTPTAVRDGRTNKAKSLLAGILRCDSCGHVMGLWYPAKKEAGRTAPRYQCVNLNCTRKVTVHRPAVEDLVVQEAFAVDLRLIAQPQDVPDLAPLEEALTHAERRFAQVQSPEAMDALGDAWPVAVKGRRLERDEAALALGKARAESGLPSSGGTVLRLGHIWDDLDPSQQREALSWTFEAVRVRKVPRGHAPDLEFVVRATRPFGTLELRPPEIETATPGMDAGA